MTEAGESIGTIFSYQNNPRVFKALICAKYRGVTVDVAPNFHMGVDNKSEEFLARFPMGKVPAMDVKNVGPLFESNAIAQYISSCSPATSDGNERPELRGRNPYESAQIQQYLSFADNELNPPLIHWLYPLNGYMPYNKANTEGAKEQMKRALKALNALLEGKTFLVGESVTLADITLFCTLLNAYKRIFSPEFREPFPNVNRWFVNCANQPEFSSVVGEVVLAEVEEVYVSRRQSSPRRMTREEELVPVDENVFSLESWKRVYSNQTTRPDAINWFWQKFPTAATAEGDSNQYSIWRVDYKFNDELDKIFMSSNLISGFFQRIDKARKQSFGSMIVFGIDGKNEIKGIFLFKGQEIPEVIKNAADFESYDFTKVSFDDPRVRTLWEDYVAFDGELEGKTFADGKIFK